MFQSTLEKCSVCSKAITDRVSSVSINLSTNEYFIYKVDVGGYVLAKDPKIFPASEINKDILIDKYKHLG